MTDSFHCTQSTPLKRHFRVIYQIGYTFATLQRHHEEVAANPVQWMPWVYRDTLARVAKGSLTQGVRGP